ncbi:hypothetical protein LJC34_05455 [Oscillospiraceae bacterium OttesenSCG-928-G22]|nr:hypothetical protein [Oscillospiraceae bacterium OttesenSCG-928-G22]
MKYPTSHEEETKWVEPVDISKFDIKSGIILELTEAELSFAAFLVELEQVQDVYVIRQKRKAVFWIVISPYDYTHSSAVTEFCLSKLDDINVGPQDIDFILFDAKQIKVDALPTHILHFSSRR